MTITPPFRILTVCTGNICRSPMAERLLQHGLNLVTPGAYKVESAGTGAMIGSAMEPHVEGFVRVLGASAENFSSRQLTPEVLAAQDLVLAMTREHRSSIVEMAPALLKKTFTLRELARTLPQLDTPKGLDPAERWAAIIPLALRARSRQGHNVTDDDVVDPFRRDDGVYDQMRRELNPAIMELIKWERTNSRTIHPRRYQFRGRDAQYNTVEGRVC